MKDMVYKKHLGKDRYKLQMAPMVDVVFQLLIFFLVASEVRPTEADFKANLPAGSGPLDAKVTKKEVARVYLRNLDTQGNAVEVSLNGEVLPGDPFKTLETRLRAARSDNMLLVIDGDPTVKLKFIAKALDSGVAAGAPQITFGKPQT
ncbi:MAG TPA: biopolymer transporter ExbD [Planctomycetota bacterium]|nr:biopolymer transporter ExbD [Planctomycetota bacterium]